VRAIPGRRAPSETRSTGGRRLYNGRRCVAGSRVGGVGSRAPWRRRASWGSRRCWPSRAWPSAHRRASSTSACHVCPRRSTLRTRAIPRSSSRCASSIRDWSDSASAETSSPRSRPRGPCRGTVSRGRSGSARTCSCTTAPRSARRGGADAVRANLGGRAAGRDARVGPPVPRGRPDGPRGAPRRGDVDPDHRRSTVRAPPRAPGPSRSRDRGRPVRRRAGRKRPLPGRRAHRRAAEPGSGPDVAGRPAPERPADPACGRRRCGGTRRPVTRRPASRRARRRAAVVGRRGTPGCLRAHVAAGAPRAQGRSGTHQPQDGAAGGGARARSGTHPSGPRSVGGAVLRVVAARRLGGARRRPARLRRDALTDACWPGWGRSIRR
jgi:hypothetical protein